MTNFQYLWTLFFSVGPSILISIMYQWWWGLVALPFILISGFIFSLIMLYIFGAKLITFRAYVNGPLFGGLAMIIANYIHQ